MKGWSAMNVRINIQALRMVLALALITGCAQTQLVPQNAMQVGSDTSLRAVPVCAGSRINQAQCDVLVERDSPQTKWHGWSALDIEKAYNLPSLSEGEGQTVAIIDPYDNPRVAKDLEAYRSLSGLPKASFGKYNQKGQKGNYPEGSQDWGIEIDLDVEMAAASCPHCTIDLVESNSTSWQSLGAAEREAVKLGATVVSNSYGGTGGNCSYYGSERVTYVASSGDSGLGIRYPASCSHVVAVGGTVLTPAKTKRGYNERLWSESGGACSVEPKPSWQYDTKCANRLADDVSAVAYGVAEYDTYGATGWIEVDGTSISAPLVAGIFGLAGNSTDQDGGRTFWARVHHKYLYKITVPQYSDQGGWGSPEGTGAF
jgi:subtilase family serine protease